MKTSTHHFDHEKLSVYQRSIEFVRWASDLLDRVPRSASVHNQLDRASSSVPLNIAEGNGKFTSKDRCKVFDISRGSALESAACLDILVAKRILEMDGIAEGKRLLRETVSMLHGLIRANSDDRVYQSPENDQCCESDNQRDSFTQLTTQD